MIHRLFILVGLTLGAGIGAHAEDAAKDIHKGPLESRVNALVSIQPGLGAVMHEMGRRFADTYWAANGGNWGLAQYELKELLEAQEVAEITRPQRAPMLKAFEGTYLVPLGEAIAKKDISQFNRRFSAAAGRCNACHTELGYGFIQYRVPKQRKQELLDFTMKTEPKYDEAKESK